MSSGMLNKRLEWFIDKLSQGFSVERKVADACVRDNRKKLDTFLLDVNSPSKLFFFYQPRLHKRNELFMTLSVDNDRLSGRCMYFLRDAVKAVQVKVYCDSTVICGELTEDILQVFQSTLSEIFYPLLQQQDTWGLIKEDEEKDAFLTHLRKFDVNLQSKIRNLRGDIELETPKAPFDTIKQKPAAYTQASRNPAVLKKFSSIVTNWIARMTKYIDDDASSVPLIETESQSDRKTFDEDDEEIKVRGPEEEVDYWSRRLLTLISVTEQLKTKHNRVVTGVLKARALRADDSTVNSNDPTSAESAKALIERWRDVDLRITDALNEARDNVRFLENLRKVVEPLADATPDAIYDAMPALMNSMKMINTLSRHYGTEVRMTNLFVRLTNMMIHRCQVTIYKNDDPLKLWDQPSEEVVAQMRSSIRLCEHYQYHYRITKETLARIPKGKQFDFDETVIFGKFIRFRRRLEKLIDMFSSVQQFAQLDAKKIDGFGILIDAFDHLIKEFRAKDHHLLDYNNTVFERDYVEFTMRNSGLENAIQNFMAQSLAQLRSIDKKLLLLHKFGTVLEREALRDDLDAKYLQVFKAYGRELVQIYELYLKQCENPPLQRNITLVAGNIRWARQLLRRIIGPMELFRQVPKVFHPKDSKKIIKRYNGLAEILVEFQTRWFKAWSKSTANAKKGLRAALLVQDPKTRKLHVNFDPGVLRLMKEARHLQLMGFKIPNSAKIVLLLEEKLKTYHNQLVHAVDSYDRVTAMVQPVTESLLRPHLNDLFHAIRPALESMTWISMNIPHFLKRLQAKLSQFEYLVKHVNDLVANRVQKNLEFVRSLVLVNLPKEPTFALRDFQEAQKKHLAVCGGVFVAKNEEILRAVEDLIESVMSYRLHSSIRPCQERELDYVRLHYSHLMYHALLSSVKLSLRLLRCRLGNVHLDGVTPLEGYAPLLEVELSLQTPKICVIPSLNSIHEVVNTVGRNIIQMTKEVYDWGIEVSGDRRDRREFFYKVAMDKNLAINCLLLTGSMVGLKATAKSYLENFSEYESLWGEDPEESYAKFVAKHTPILEDFVVELKKFVTVEKKVAALDSTADVGCFQVDCTTLKGQLTHEVQRWKLQYSEKQHAEAKREMESVVELMASLKAKLEREIEGFASLKFVMDAQQELRDVQSWIEPKFLNIIERYNTLEDFLPEGAMSKDEMDAKTILRTQWEQILAISEKVTVEINDVKAGYKQELATKVRQFKKNVVAFRTDYEENGPQVPGIQPQDAITRLSKYRREFDTLYRKYEMYNGGERLFGLPEQKYPSLAKTKQNLRLLDQLYNLYEKVITTVDDYRNIPWAEVVANIGEMNETIGTFKEQCNRLPKQLREWEAYMELDRTISDFIGILPLLTELSKKAMRPRHWEQISAITNYNFDINKFDEMKLQSILEARLTDHAEDIIEITDSAEKQLIIEKRIVEIQKNWDEHKFSFAECRDRGEVILGSTVTELMEFLEEDQASLVQNLTQRHVAPFRDTATFWLNKLSDVADTLDRWIKVQMLWMSLESVFTTGDIARQMPTVSRLFQDVDKEWTSRLMNKAKDVKNVVDCCQNEYIKNMLPDMFVRLEKCQKALDGYLETKRGKFPRFYFVSNPALLRILSTGTDPDLRQECFPKVFDAICKVDFQGNNITHIKQEMTRKTGGMDTEVVPLHRNVVAKGNIEDWLGVLLKQMMATMRRQVGTGAEQIEGTDLETYVKEMKGQVCLLGIQFMWTRDVEDALSRKGDKNAMKAALTKATTRLSLLSQMTTGDIDSKLERIKIETLVTIQVHQKDVLEQLISSKVKSELDFDWQKQMRCYWLEEHDHCVVRIADVAFDYCYEYLGCKDRLVVTPLTDRCYISVSQAIGMNFGGAPAGPAGTGKTETVKDLARALGKYVMVFNCSDQMHTADTAKIYKGLCMSGSWGCFDEFNRIELEVLSVVAQQVAAILHAFRNNNEMFRFPGDTQDIKVDRRCAFCITMNPGYAGRVELPENLKALFRGVAMMVPDRGAIIKVKLAAVGYSQFEELAKKFKVLYSLCEEQLSDQRHYDFGLRNILSVLRTAGRNLLQEMKDEAVEAAEAKEGAKPKDAKDREERLMMRTLRDMNLSKLVSDDVPLFESLLVDLFPNQPLPKPKPYEDVEDSMAQVMKERGLVEHKKWVTKAVQLYETSEVRHGLMMVGPTGGGKTTAIEVLVEALSRISATGKYHTVFMNPKAIQAEEMFGQNDVVSGEWTHGIFSSIWAKVNEPKYAAKQSTWIVCDGPVDSIWIENLNTVLDDNKVLTLANSDRIDMSSAVRLLFEVENLRNASPATVSRAGIIYVSTNDLGYAPIFQAWLNSRQNDAERKSTGDAVIADLWKRAFYKETDDAKNILDWMYKKLNLVMPVGKLHLVENLCTLLDGLLQDFPSEQRLQKPANFERLWVYALIWALGGVLEAPQRLELCAYVARLYPDNLPELDEGETLYDYFVSAEDDYEWERWEAGEWEYDAKTFNFTRVLIPTIDSAQADFLLDSILYKLEHPVVILGSSGTGKTSTVLQYCQTTFDPTQHTLKKVNFSSATTAGMFQRSMEADIEKRQARVFGPVGGRSMTVFLDDLSMPEVNKWGDQPTLELVRQIIERDGFYSLEKDKRGEFVRVESVTYIGAMNHPGGGRNDIPARLKRHFFTLNMTPPSLQTIDNIYGSMLRGRFDFKHDLIEKIEGLTAASITMWQWAKRTLLPTPSKFHYVFNMRDLSKIFQGILLTPLDILQEGNTIYELWVHECDRVFSDKLTNAKDKNNYRQKILEVVGTEFGDEVRHAFRTRKQPLYFVDFLRDEIVDPETEEVVEEAPKIYEPVVDLQGLHDRIMSFLDLYNEQTGVQRMDLVMFQDALEHLMRISRIIGRPRGNALLVGVGGSGRQSLTKLAAFIATHEVFQISLTAAYKTVDLLEDIRKLYEMVGKDGKSVTWIITDFEIIEDEFLEYINAILATGEVAGLFPNDERDMMISECRNAARKEIPGFEDTQQNLYAYFINRIRDNLHIVLAFSPANDKFADRARRFPGIISCTTIDWFMKWPKAALEDVSYRFLIEDANFAMSADEPTRYALVRYIANVHSLVVKGCDDYLGQYRRQVYVTPKSYLSFINSYKAVYLDKLAEISRLEHNVRTGLQKLQDAERDVDNMSKKLEQQNKDLRVAEQFTLQMMDQLSVGKKEAEKRKIEADRIEARCTKTANEIREEERIANIELQEAMPHVTMAKVAARGLNKPDLANIVQYKKPVDLIKRIMDCVLILNYRDLDKVQPMDINIGKNEWRPFIKDSYDNSKRMMVESGFIRTLMEFSEQKRDDITEESMELLEPYFRQENFTSARAKKVANAAESLCKWVHAMYNYHNASKIVGPKLEQLRIKSAKFAVAKKRQAAAQRAAAAAQAEVDKMQADYDATVDKKKDLEDQAKQTQQKMVAANNLIRSLAGEKQRWKRDAEAFEAEKLRLVGDCALACAFVSYLGPFNHTFRNKYLNDVFYNDCLSRNIPVTENLDVNKFLVDDGTIADWNQEGLPKDELSVQNGILVTQAARYPLLIDPQGQGLQWLMRKEEKKLPDWGITTLTNEKLRDQLNLCMRLGLRMLVEGVVADVDPMFDPVLEKNIVMKGKTSYIIVGGQEFEVVKDFKLYLVTKLSNPLFSPELSAKTTIIDFSVTQKGLENQLLSRVIQYEQEELEQQRSNLIEEVNINTKSLQRLDKLLLSRLTASKEDLLADVELITMLQETKLKAQEVKDKIDASREMEGIINQKREQYRPVAARGSAVYFVIVSMSQVNNMYQTSLRQFLQWFDASLHEAEKPANNNVQRRVEILKEYLSFKAYKNVSIGLFEKDKLTFKVMLALKIMLDEYSMRVNQDMVNILLRGGADHVETERPPHSWLDKDAWLNACAVSSRIDFLSELRSSIAQNETPWRKWMESSSPETMRIPRLEDQLNNHTSRVFTSFMRLTIIRALRNDRFRLAAGDFVSVVLGDEYVEPFPNRLEDILLVSDAMTPVVMLLTPGADPTAQLTELAGKKGVAIASVSMGEGQEPHARAALFESMQNGGWALLQNCHLGLGFMRQMEDVIKDKEADPEFHIDENFRLWITCEPHPNFPVNLLQMSIKKTNEPPRGLKAGLLRSYSSVVDSSRLVRSDTKEWRDMVFTLCFLHSVVQERRKFGPIGWAIPYEFNVPDLEASLVFLEQHFDQQHDKGLNWPTVRYMITDIQYGGKITDPRDELLFKTYGDQWLTQTVLSDENFCFAEVKDHHDGEAKEFQYKVPQDTHTIENYHSYIGTFPVHDSPTVFGLDPNADLQFGTIESQYILDTIDDTQPKEVSGSTSGQTPDEVVIEKSLAYLEKLKLVPLRAQDDIRERIRHRRQDELEYVLGTYWESIVSKYKASNSGVFDGISIPLNIFLYQELFRLNATIRTVKQTLSDLELALKGDIIMTPALQDAFDAVFGGKAPSLWYCDASGKRVAWAAPSLKVWFDGLQLRAMQLEAWLVGGRPNSYWMTGFYNPQGFLTATRQEVTRRHAQDKWALDDVVYVTEVQSFMDHRKIKAPHSQGVYIHGLFLEGAAFDRNQKVLKLSEQELNPPLPVLLVTAMTRQAAQEIKYPHKVYSCPVFMNKERKQLNYIFNVRLETTEEPKYWVLRGVALLCSRD